MSSNPSAPGQSQGYDAASPSWVKIPVELTTLFDDSSRDNINAQPSEMLCIAHPWLRELSKDYGIDFLDLRQTFLTDGFTFISALGKFLDAMKWQEFVLAFALASSYGRSFLILLECVARKRPPKGGVAIPMKSDTMPRPPSGKALAGRYDLSRVKDQPRHQKLKRHPDDHIYDSHPLLRELLASRWDDSDTLPHKERLYTRKKVISALAEGLRIDFEAATKELASIEDWIDKLRSLNVEDLRFGLAAHDETKEPWPLHYSPRWQRIGRNLNTLGALVGADLTKSENSTEPVSIFQRLRDAVNREGAVTKVMLGRIEELNNKMSQQQQVITALQFRHLLENLPKTLGRRKVMEAGDGAAGAKVAEKWDQMNQKERWMEFWEEAVRQVYEVYLDHGSGSWTESDTNQKPSPLASLLERYLPEALEKEKSGKEKKGTAVRWLARESPIAERMGLLYSTLSQSIHQFSAGKFKVDPLNFSPGDVQLLTALTPKQAGEEDVDWKKEFRRYVWRSVAKTAGRSTAAPKEAKQHEAEPPSKQAESKATDSKTVAPEAKDVAQNESFEHDRFNARWNATQTSDRYLGLFARELTLVSVKQTPGPIAATIDATYERPAIDSKTQSPLPSPLPNVILAALVDLVGRTVTEALEHEVIDKQLVVELQNIKSPKAGGLLQLSSETKETRGKQRFWSTEVKIKDTDDIVARGTFKVPIQKLSGQEKLDKQPSSHSKGDTAGQEETEAVRTNQRKDPGS